MKKLSLFAGLLLAAASALAVTANPYVPNSAKLLEQSAVAVNVTGTSTETTQYTANIPGGTLGPNGLLALYMLHSHTNSANNKTIKVKIGASVLATVVDTTSASQTFQMVLANRGATNSQVITPNVNSFGVSASSPVLTSIDTSVDQALTVTCTLATSTESCQMELISIDIYKP